MHYVKGVPIDHTGISYNFKIDFHVVQEFPDYSFKIFPCTARAHLTEVQHCEFFQVFLAVRLFPIAGAYFEDLYRVRQNPVQFPQVVIEIRGKHWP